MTKVRSVDNFTYTTAIKKLRKLTKRVKVIPGGTGGGKTYGILPLLIDTAAKIPELEISVVSESVPHLRKGAIKDFLKIMKATGRYIDSNWHQTHSTYTFVNGSYIEFFSADNEDKVRGPRRNILYINECNNIAGGFETYHQLAIRTSMSIWLDFNPSNDFWAYQELKADEDIEWLTLTYLDNEGLPESIVKEIEKAKAKAYHDPDGDIHNPQNVKNKYWDNWWRVYGCGLLGALEGVVFTNWQQVATIPIEAKLVAYGLDFGFTNDPTGCIAVFLHNGELWLNEILYQTGLTNPDIKNEIYPLVGRNEVIADSAEPKSIEELKRMGMFVSAAIKGADSIKNGIDILQRYKFNVTNSSVNLIKELRQYCWDTDKEGKKLNQPIDGFNHLIDPLRYVALNKLTENRASAPKISFGKR